MRIRYFNWEGRGFGEFWDLGNSLRYVSARTSQDQPGLDESFFFKKIIFKKINFSSKNLSCSSTLDFGDGKTFWEKWVNAIYLVVFNWKIEIFASPGPGPWVSFSSPDASVSKPWRPELLAII